MIAVSDASIDMTEAAMEVYFVAMGIAGTNDNIWVDKIGPDGETGAIDEDLCDSNDKRRVRGTNFKEVPSVKRKWK